MVLPAPRLGGMQLEESDMTCQGTCYFIAHLQRSSQGQRGCWRSPHGHCSRRVEGERLDRLATDLSPHAGQWRANAQWPRPRQSTGSWFVVEYGSQALDHIGTVLGPTSGAKGTVPLSTQEPRRGPECQTWALLGPDPLAFVVTVPDGPLCSAGGEDTVVWNVIRTHGRSRFTCSVKSVGCQST